MGHIDNHAEKVGIFKWINNNRKKKKVVPKRELYDVLTLAHRRTAHHGHQITAEWIIENYSEVKCEGGGDICLALPSACRTTIYHKSC